MSCIDEDRTGRLLSKAVPGDRGTILRVHPHVHAGDPLTGEELERRLLELGFVEGAIVEVLHEGLFGGDPIAVRVDDLRVALRRHEAASIEIDFQAGGAA